MEFQPLREFLAVTETLNFSSAADRCFTSQSTLSKHIRELERELGAPLFRRSTRRVELTELGLRLLPHVRRAVALEADILRETEKYHDQMSDRLIIGCINRWDGINWGKLTVEFQKERPQTYLNFATDEYERLIAMLKKDEYDFIVVREIPGMYEDGLNRILLCEDPIYAFLPAGHPLALVESIRLSQLRQEQFLMSNKGELACQLSVNACMEAGFSPNIIYHGGRPQAINYLILGLGVGLMFLNPLDFREGGADVVIRPLEPKVYAEINLVYKENTLSDAGIDFLTYMKQYSF